MHTAAKTMQAIKAVSWKATSKLDTLEAKYNSMAHHFKDLSNDDLALLAGILAHQPSPSIPESSSQHTAYARITKSDIDKLPSHLRGYPSTLVRYVARIAEDIPDLCPLHHKLCGHQMGSILRFIKREIDVHIPIVHRNLSDAGVISMEVNELFQSVRKISAMWINQQAYFDAFEEEPKPQWVYQSDGCAACVLSRLGGEPNVLVALKVAMITRSRSDAMSSSRRHIYVDSLIINGFVAIEAGALMHKAIRLGAEVWYQWSGLVAKHKEKKKDEKAAAAAARVNIAVKRPTDGEGEDIYDAIDDIINDYRYTRHVLPESNSLPSQSSLSTEVSSIYTTSDAHPPPALNPSLQPGKSYHVKSYSDNTPYRAANSYALSYHNVLGKSGPYQRVDAKGKGRSEAEKPAFRREKHRPQTLTSPLTPKKSPAESEGTTWGGFLERVYHVQEKGKGR